MKYWQPYGITDPDAKYFNGDPPNGQPGSIPTAGSVEQDQREIINLIKGNAMTPSEASVNQLLVAFRSQRMNYAVATNTNPNAIAVAFNPPIAATMTPGMPLRIKPPLNNTGPCTLIVDGVSHPLRRADGLELEENDITNHVPFECLWNDAGYWVLTNFRSTGSIQEGDTTNNSYITHIPYADDVGTPNHIIANFTPPITAPIPGDAIEVRLTHSIAGATGIVINGLPEVAVTRPNGSALQGGDGAVDQVALLLRANNGTWQFSGVVPQPISGFLIPVGCLLISMNNLAIPGTLKLNGALLNRSEHPGLWNYANGSSRIVDEVVWQNAAQRSWTAFSRGDGGSTFRLPDFRAEFPRWWDDGRGQDTGRVLGTQQDEDFKSHKHPVDNAGDGPWIWSAGYATTGEDGSATFPGGSGSISVTIDPTGGPETRPRNIAVVPCIVDG